jgi:hypothetical protein
LPIAVTTGDLQARRPARANDCNLQRERAQVGQRVGLLVVVQGDELDDRSFPGDSGPGHGAGGADEGELKVKRNVARRMLRAALPLAGLLAQPAVAELSPVCSSKTA